MALSLMLQLLLQHVLSPISNNILLCDEVMSDDSSCNNSEKITSAWISVWNTCLAGSGRANENFPNYLVQNFKEGQLALYRLRKLNP